MCVNRQTLSSGLGPDSLWGTEWVRHSYQQQAQAASVSASLHKESTRHDTSTDTHTHTRAQKKQADIHVEPTLFFALLNSSWNNIR